MCVWLLNGARLCAGVVQPTRIDGYNLAMLMSRRAMCEKCFCVSLMQPTIHCIDDIIAIPDADDACTLMVYINYIRELSYI